MTDIMTGVNVHDELGSTSPYANGSAVAQALLILRPKIVRGISPMNVAGMRALAALGIGYIIMCRQSPARTTTALYEPGVRIAQAAGVPVAIEGYNEPDLAKPVWTLRERYQLLGWRMSQRNLQYRQMRLRTDPGWVLYTRELQAALYAVGQTLGVTVLGPSVVFAEGAQALGPVPMDKLNVHTYGWPHSAVPDVAGAIAAVRSLAPDAGVWVTEVGGSTYRNWPFGRLDMTEAQQASLMMKARDVARRLGVEAFVVYELVDQCNSGDWLAAFDREKRFGLFRADWTPKPLATALEAA